MPVVHGKIHLTISCFSLFSSLSQEFTRAFNAYSAAVKLSPVGPSSHVFLSNRAAALLSLKRYSAAAVDARRAVALAPAFGKAHARLGQSLYFLKDYVGAVAAYEDAAKLEPDNPVTWTYLKKAKSKLAKQYEKDQRRDRGEELSVTASKDSTMIGGNSIATDPHASAAVVGSHRSSSTRLLSVTGSEYRKSGANGSYPYEVKTKPMGDGQEGSHLMSPIGMSSPTGAATSMNTAATPHRLNLSDNGEDPDFEEAVELQRRATEYLSQKQYRKAVDEYSAALFLVPDDAALSSQLHIGRAHALNGLKRHDSATNDARMACKIDRSSAEAYSVLAKSLFYSKHFEDAIEAFQESSRFLCPGEVLSAFDDSYLQRAKEALENGEEVPPEKPSGTVPKLKPPRFVPRDEVMGSTPKLPSMPKEWPQQSPNSELRIGPERDVLFYSESMGVKLNRGPDGIVRIMSIAPISSGSLVSRKGEIHVGDVVREAAKVDMRRPMTKVMWGDTVTVVKLAPRPVKLVVAKEESPVPQSVSEEMTRLKGDNVSLTPSKKDKGKKIFSPSKKGRGRKFFSPSPANGEEPVSQSIASKTEGEDGGAEDEVKLDYSGDMLEDFPQCAPNDDEDSDADGVDYHEGDTVEKSIVGDRTSSSSDEMHGGAKDAANAPEVGDETKESNTGVEELEEDGEPSESLDSADQKKFVLEQPQLSRPSSADAIDASFNLEWKILFNPNTNYSYNDEWWEKTAESRTVVHASAVTRLVRIQRGLGFGLIPPSEHYRTRILALFKTPDVLLVLRRPKSISEVRKLLEDSLSDEVDVMQGYLIAESVVDLNMCKMRLSQLTTPTSISSLEANSRASLLPSDMKRCTCFEIFSPTETIELSCAVKEDDERENQETPSLLYTDTRSYLETSAWETALSMSLHAANAPSVDEVARHYFETDQAWKHVIVRGSLHSHVVYGNIDVLNRALEIALSPYVSIDKDGETEQKELCKEAKANILNERDDFGLTALMYACTRRLQPGVAALVKAGANCTVTTPRDLKSPVHLSAECLDEKSLSTVLSSNSPARPDPNALDINGRTPMYLAAVHGKTAIGGDDHFALGCCLSALDAWGGQIYVDDPEGRSQLHHPVACRAIEWKAAEVETLLSHINYFYPLRDETSSGLSVKESIYSTAQHMHYPIHAALVTLRKRIANAKADGFSDGFNEGESPLVATLRVLLMHGFDVNERMEHIEVRGNDAAELNALVGFTPLQVLAAAALDAQDLASQTSKNSEACEGGDMATVERTMIEGIMRCLSETSRLLVRCGGQIGAAIPPMARKKDSNVTSRKRIPKPNLGRGGSAHSAGEAREDPGVEDDPDGMTATDLPPVNRADVKIDENEAVLHLLGGEDSLGEARDSWLEEKPVRESPSMKLFPNVSKEEARGDSSSCTICWKSFGSVTNRRQMCRVTKLYVCDGCSNKRMYDSNAVEHRICDGIFILAQVEGSKADEIEQKLFDEERQQRQEAQKRERGARMARPPDPTAQGDTEKQELFRGAIEAGNDVMKNMRGFFMEDAEDDDKLESIAGKMSATRDALNERGEKLAGLAEKSAALQDASRDFAAMAKELNRQTKSRGLFW